MKLVIFFLSVLFISCAHSMPKLSDNTMGKFEEFKKKEKFIEDTTTFYPGIAEESLRSEFSKRINLAADDFMKIAQTKNASSAEYQEAIKKGLNRFSTDDIVLDTEDREQVCRYFEELMDIVGLESSGGQLNKFMYGFELGE